MEGDSDIKKQLTNMYYDYKKDYGLSGINKMMKAIKKQKLNISKKQLMAFLRSQEAYTLHAPANQKMARKPILAFAIEHNLHMDLADLSTLYQYNYGIRFLCILVF